MYDDYMIPDESNRWSKFGNQSWEARKEKQQEKFGILGANINNSVSNTAFMNTNTNINAWNDISHAQMNNLRMNIDNDRYNSPKMVQDVSVYNETRQYPMEESKNVSRVYDTINFNTSEVTYNDNYGRTTVTPLVNTSNTTRVYPKYYADDDYKNRANNVEISQYNTIKGLRFDSGNEMRDFNIHGKKQFNSPSGITIQRPLTDNSPRIYHVTDRGIVSLTPSDDREYNYRTRDNKFPSSRFYNSRDNRRFSPKSDYRGRRFNDYKARNKRFNYRNSRKEEENRYEFSYPGGRERYELSDNNEPFKIGDVIRQQQQKQQKLAELMRQQREARENQQKQFIENLKRAEEEKRQKQQQVFNKLFRKEHYNLPSYGMEGYMVKEAAVLYGSTETNETQNINNNTNVNQRNSNTTNTQNINDTYNEINSSYDTAINIICKTIEEESKKVQIENTQNIEQKNVMKGKNFVVQGEGNEFNLNQTNKLDAKAVVNYMAKAVTDITDTKVNKAMVADFLGVTNKTDNSNATDNSLKQGNTAETSNKNKQEAKASTEKFVKESMILPLVSKDVTNIVQNTNNNTNINQVSETVRNQLELNKETNIQNFVNRMSQNTEDIQEMRNNLEQNLKNALSASQSNVFDFENVGIGGKNNKVNIDQQNEIVSDILTKFDETVEKVKKLSKTTETTQNNTQNITNDTKSSNSIKDTVDQSNGATVKNDNDQSAVSTVTASSIFKTIILVVVAIAAFGAVMMILKMMMSGGGDDDVDEVIVEEAPQPDYGEAPMEEGYEGEPVGEEGYEE